MLVIAKFALGLAKFVLFSRKKGFLLQLVGVLLSHFAKFVLFLCQICVSFDKFVSDFDKFVSDPSQKGVFIATGWYSIFSNMILPNKKAPGGDYPGCS